MAYYIIPNVQDVPSIVREIKRACAFGASREEALTHICKELEVPEDKIAEVKAAFDEMYPAGFQPKVWHFEAGRLCYRLSVKDGQVIITHDPDGNPAVAPEAVERRTREFFADFEQHKTAITAYLTALKGA